jgi:tryptophan halogenase
MNKQVKNICIFGTGSAGLITALSMNVYLPDVNVTLLNSTKHKNIGVGESTQPDLIDLLDIAGIDILDFINHVDGTLKHGIYYKNWNKENVDYWHPFASLPRDGMYSRAHHYHQMSLKDPINYPRQGYYKNVHPSYTLCVENNLSSADIGHALHVDSDKLAIYLKNYLKDKIRIIDCDTFNINHNNTQINSIIVNSNTTVESDLFIDCSGFSRVLIGKISNLEEDEYEGAVNSAVVARINYTQDNVKSFPYTRAEAWSQGWIWTIPLQSRVGSGCLYNDKFCTDREAKTHFVNYWQGALKEEDIEKISFSSKSLKSPWVNNVVAVGLSSGFIEPLEATGISWFVQSGRVLGAILQSRYYDEDIATRFNSIIRGYIEDVQDFIDTHYLLSERKDSEFWQYQTSRTPSLRLNARLELYRKLMPNINNRNKSYAWAFGDISWIDILTGYNFEFNNIEVPRWLTNQRQVENYRNPNEKIT